MQVVSGSDGRSSHMFSLTSVFALFDRFMGFRVYRKPERIMAGAGLGVFALGSIVVGFFDPGKAALFPGCPLLQITGFACPGCGLTRGFHSLFHGEFLLALDFNALIPIFALVFAYLTLLATSIAITGRDLRFRILTPTTLWVFLTIAAVFGVLRNIPVYPLSVLFP